MITLKLTLLLLPLLGYREAVAQCFNGWTRFEDSCYKIVQNKVNWIEAHDYCRLFGSYLVEMTSRDEINFAAREFSYRNLDSGLWIGLSDILDEGKWMWTTEQNIATETAWASGQPDNHKDGNKEEDCVLIDGDLKWHDDVCNYDHFFMCEMSQTDPVIG